jgi:hypothetical protein
MVSPTLTDDFSDTHSSMPAIQQLADRRKRAGGVMGTEAAAQTATAGCKVQAEWTATHAESFHS